MSKKGLGKFIVGAGIGAAIGLIFAPKKGSELRKDLMDRIKDLYDQVKDIDSEDVREEFDKKIDQIKKELKDLDKEKVLKIAKKKSEDLQKRSQELVDLAIDKGTPILRDAADEVLDKTIEVTREVLKKLEAAEKNVK